MLDGVYYYIILAVYYCRPCIVRNHSIRRVRTNKIFSSKKSSDYKKRRKGIYKQRKNISLVFIPKIYLRLFYVPLRLLYAMQQLCNSYARQELCNSYARQALLTMLYQPNCQASYASQACLLCLIIDARKDTTKILVVSLFIYIVIYNVLLFKLFFFLFFFFFFFFFQLHK